MRAFRILITVMALVLVACGGGDDAADGGVADGGETGGAQNGGVLPTDFSTADLPGDFPQELIIPDIVGGEGGDIGGIETWSFETTMSYDDTIAFYTDALGDPTFEGGDADGRLGSWVSSGPWAVTVLDTEPTTVSVGRVPQE